MQSMIEKVAEAIYDANDGPNRHAALWFWKNLSFDQKEHYRVIARAAIAAMREPNDAMLGVGYASRTVWMRMIEAALAEKEG